VARKTKFTTEVEDRLLRALRLGCYVETAAALAGISRDTFYDWIKKGAKGVAPYAAFARKVDQAMAESEARDLAVILKAAEKNWTAAAWRLERRFPDRYGRNDRTRVEAKVEVTTEGEGLVQKLARLIDGDAPEKKRGRPPKATPTEKAE
jgi:transposase